jgi:hypothetical protein
MADLFTFRQPAPLAPPGASPLLASILLAIELCEQPGQLASWWDWDNHRAARWHLSPEEQRQANAARLARESALQARGGAMQ